MVDARARMTDVIGYAVSFLLGLGMGGLYPMLRQRRRTAVELPAVVEESVTVFGEEMAALEFDVNGPDAIPAVLKEYRAALAAYDRASAARTEHDALTALRDGRAAMIRLDARRHGRPVPIDVLPPAAGPGRPQPLTGTGERHVYTGYGDGTTEVLIDRPEPGRPALVEVDVTGNGGFEVATVTRTEGGTPTGGRLIWISGEYHGRCYLPADATHLTVTTDYSWNDHRWSIRVVPLSAATTLVHEHHGHGDEVLRYNGGPTVLTAQFRTGFQWQVRYVCGQCLRSWPDCDCRPFAWPRNTPGYDWSQGDLKRGVDEGRYTLRLPRPGFLVIQEDRGGGSWHLTIQPVDISPSALLRRFGRLGRRR